MNQHNNPNRILPFAKIARALGEDEPISLEKDIRTLGKDEMRIIDLALGDRAKALLEWAGELKQMGHEDTAKTITLERRKTLDLHDLINEAWQVDLIPEE